jgi:hypothetical protein
MYAKAEAPSTIGQRIIPTMLTNQASVSLPASPSLHRGQANAGIERTT